MANYTRHVCVAVRYTAGHTSRIATASVAGSAASSTIDSSMPYLVTGYDNASRTCTLPPNRAVSLPA